MAKRLYCPCGRFAVQDSKTGKISWYRSESDPPADKIKKPKKVKTETETPPVRKGFFE